jgi:hypothetical protein
VSKSLEIWTPLQKAFLPQRTQRAQRNRVEISVFSVLFVVLFCFLQQSHLCNL